MNGIREEKYVADTNALIYLLSGNKCMEPFSSASLLVSVISEMELLSFPEMRKGEEAIIRSYLSACTVLPLNTSVKETAISLRRKYRIKLPDAIVAATAVSYEVPLLTADKGFSKIEELRLKLLMPE